MRAYGFRDTDGWWNKPDPYVEAMLNGQTMTTAVHDDTMHAAFDHKFCFQGALSVQAYETGGMTLTLLDDDSWLTKSFDHLGTFYLNALETGDFTKEDGPAKLDISVRIVPASDAALIAAHPDYKQEDPVVYYPASYVLPANLPEGTPSPMVVASSANMVDAKTQLGLDFEGIWWMSDNPVAEELVSFASATLNSSTFPANLAVPNAKAGMWSWLTDTMGDILRRYYATGDPVGITNFTFVSPVKGFISTGLVNVPLVWVEDGFPFYKYTPDCDTTAGGKQWCDPSKCASTSASGTTCAQLIAQYPNDMWSRPTVFNKEKWRNNVIPCPWAPISNWRKPWWPDTTYTLKRIVLADGSPHPVFWNEWLEHTKAADGTAGGKMLQSYMSDHWCNRIKAAGSVFDLLGGPPHDCP